MKLLFPHWSKIEDVNLDEFRIFCLTPALYRRGVIKEQCHMIDPEFKEDMPDIKLRNYNSPMQEHDIFE